MRTVPVLQCVLFFGKFMILLVHLQLNVADRSQCLLVGDAEMVGSSSRGYGGIIVGWGLSVGSM